MNLVFFAHPKFGGHKSMPRFAAMLNEGMKKRGHSVEIISPWPWLSKIPASQSLKKWLGYFDQFILFPIVVRNSLKRFPPQTLFVFTDNALGPWVPLVAQLPHVIHCHDFLAQRSAKGEFEENLTGFSGKMYQRFIRRGYVLGKHFIPVSEKTKEDLLKFLPNTPALAEVVYNGLNQVCFPIPFDEARKKLSEIININVSDGFFLHVGGNDWYKNKIGVIEMYEAWRNEFNHNLPLLLIGTAPSEKIINRYSQSPYKSQIHFLPSLNDEEVRLAYSGAIAFLFPSIAEGFGWPIAEAMACGCPVITTNEAPMNEVAGDTAFFVKKRPNTETAAAGWSSCSAKVMEEIINLTPEKREEVIAKGLLNSKRFDTDNAIDKIEKIYLSILNKHKHQSKNG